MSRIQIPTDDLPESTVEVVVDLTTFLAAVMAEAIRRNRNDEKDESRTA